MEITFQVLSKLGEDIVHTVDTENDKLKDFINHVDDFESIRVFNDDGIELSCRLTGTKPRKWFGRNKLFTVQLTEIFKDTERNIGYTIYLAKRPNQKVLEAMEGR